MSLAIVLTSILALLSSRATVAAFKTELTKVPPPKTTPAEVFVDAPSATSPFVRWPKPILEAQGDYRDEAFLERLIGGPLYSKQQQLPRLPVPSLQETVDRFLPTALPLANDEEEKRTLLEACRSFPQEAKFLQDRLLERQAEHSESSWLQELWTKVGYLQLRDPVAVKVSYFLFVPDDPTLPADYPNGPGMARAAAVLVAMAQSRKAICSGSMPYETAQRLGKLEPLCSTGLKYLFHSCRIPREGGDTYKMYDPSLHRHCVVACRGYFFAVDFVDDLGDPLPLAVMEQRLQCCVTAAEQQEKQGHPQLGWLTSANRDFWARAREELLSVGGSNIEEALAKLESGTFVLNLDDQVEPETLTDAGRIFWHGGASCGGNRWFDKACQLVCTRNGRVAYVGEHSMLDAAPVISVLRRILRSTYKRLKNGRTEQQQQSQDDNSSNSDLANTAGGVAPIFEKCWSSPPLLAVTRNLTSIAKGMHAELTGEYDIQVVDLQGYGKKFIKQAGFLCYDYVQMAMQLAAYRLFGGGDSGTQQPAAVATYEAALTSNFLHGRTEAIRPVSPESRAFVECMGLTPHDDPELRGKKRALLEQAAAAHEKYQIDATGGMGVDRHFLGLASMMRDGDEAGPGLFSHPLYSGSKHWQLSTSSMPFAPGFGPVVDDGLGIGYLVNADSCFFTCTSRQERQYLPKFCDLLEEALLEMGDLVKATQDNTESSLPPSDEQ